MPEYRLVTRFIHTFHACAKAAIVASLYALLSWSLLLPDSNAATADRELTSAADKQSNKTAKFASTTAQLIAALEDRGGLMLGEGEQAFPAQYRQAYQPAQMSLLMLTDNIAHLSNGSIYQHLIEVLPHHNRSTLVVLLPPNTVPVPPEKNAEPATENDNTGQQAKNSTAATDVDTIAQTRIKTAIDFLREKGSQSVAIFSQQNNIRHAVSGCIDNSEQVSGLVLWKSNPSGITSKQWRALKQSRVSLLDIHDSSLGKFDRTLRQDQFRKAEFTTDYKSIRCPAGEAAQAIASRRIRHWMDTEFRKR